MAELPSELLVRLQLEVREFDMLATMLGLPAAERLSILGLTEMAYDAWQAGRIDMAAPIAPEFVRRLAYALPLMRRMAANLPMPPMRGNQGHPQLSVN